MASKKRGPHTLTCACFDSANGWVDAGCIYHGIKSGVGMWDFYDHASKMRRALMSSIRGTGRVSDAEWD